MIHRQINRKPVVVIWSAILLRLFVALFMYSILDANTPVTDRQKQQLEGLHKGSERWDVKTASRTGSSKHVDMRTLLKLRNPIKKQSEAPDKNLIPTEVDGFHEGDIVTTEGYITLLALEKANGAKDGDFHIQMHPDSSLNGGCLIVEVPDPDFISNPHLRSECAVVRDSAISKLLHGKPFNVSSGNGMVHFVQVKVTGQLFFDASHLNDDGTTQPRGKEGNLNKPDSSPTCWEIHPVSKIQYLGKKH